MNPRRTLWRFAQVVILISSTVLLPGTLFSQGITTGTVTGEVVDPSGAVIPGAHVVATDVSRGAQFTADSQKDGAFTFRAMPVGRYRMVVTATGFTALNVDNVDVNSAVTTDLRSLRMAITAATQIEVNGSAAALLETTDSQVTTTLDAQEISHLPLNNGFDTATELVPGVVSAHADAFSNSNGDEFSVNGQSSRFNNFELDGQSNNDNTIGGPQAFFGNQDAIAEFQVITNDYSAQYGRNAGAIVNYITKSGTNRFHGSGFDFYQGQFLSSFTNQEKSPLFNFCTPGEDASTGCTKPVLPRLVENRYGGTLGGPILKNKLWGFGSTYWDPIRTGAAAATSYTLTPTPTGLQALASAYPGNPAVAILQKYGPYGVKAGNPQPIGTPTMETVTGPGGVTATIPFSPVQRFIPNPYNDQEELGRLDWQPTTNDHMFLRYFYQNISVADAAGDIPSGGWVGLVAGAHSVGADWTHTFGPKWVDQLRYSFQQTNGVFEGGAFPQCTVASINACPSYATFLDGVDENFGYTFNPALPQGRIVKVTQVQNNATWSHGNQTLLFGGEIDYQNSPSTYLPFYDGDFNYESFSNFLSDGPLAGQAASDSSFLSLVDGNITTKFSELDAAGYVQDDWKVIPTLTLHIGLRWEYYSQPYNILHDETVKRESNPATAFWSTSLPLADRTVAAINNFYDDYQPRLGLAWNPVFDRSMVLSAGYAINSNPGFYNIFSYDGTTAPTANAGEILCNANCLPSSGGFSVGSVRAANLSSLPRGGDPRPLDQSIVPAGFRPPYAQTWTFAIQHQLGKAAVGEIRYTGSLTEKNFQSNNANPFLLTIEQSFPNYEHVSLCTDPTAPGYGRLNCTYDHLGIIANTAWAKYSGLQTNLTTRNLRGLTGTVSYTFSKLLDNATDAFRSTGTSGASISFPQNPLNADLGERGVGGNDFPNVVGLGFTYAFPQTERSGGLLPRLINGYSLATIYRYDSGQPYTDFQPIVLDPITGDTSYCDGSFNGDPNVSVTVDTCRLVLSNKKAPLNSVAYLNPYTGPTAGGSPTLGSPQYVVYGSDSVDNSGNYNPGTPTDPSSAHWIIDNMAYANAVNNPYPGSGRGLNRGSTFSELDATVSKSTAIREGVNLELSIGFYNALNQAYWGAPGTFVANPFTFGTTIYNNTGSIPSPTGFISGNRIAILGGKVTF